MLTAGSGAAADGGRLLVFGEGSICRQTVLNTQPLLSRGNMSERSSLLLLLSLSLLYYQKNIFYMHTNNTLYLIIIIIRSNYGICKIYTVCVCVCDVSFLILAEAVY